MSASSLLSKTLGYSAFDTGIKATSGVSLERNEFGGNLTTTTTGSTLTPFPAVSAPVEEGATYLLTYAGVVEATVVPAPNGTCRFIPRLSDGAGGSATSSAGTGFEVDAVGRQIWFNNATTFQVGAGQTTLDFLTASQGVDAGTEIQYSLTGFTLTRLD